MRTLAGLSGGVTAVGAGRLLDVEGPLAYNREKTTGQHLFSMIAAHIPSVASVCIAKLYQSKRENQRNIVLRTFGPGMEN